LKFALESEGTETVRRKGKGSMFYLLLAITANSLMMFVMRYSEKHEGNRDAATVFNYVAGIVITVLLMKEKVFFTNSPAGWIAVGLGAFNAVCMVGGMFLNLINVGKNGAPMTATFGKLGILIPTILSMILFREIPSVVQLVGLVLAVAAIIYLNGGTGEGGGIRSLPLLLILFLVSGFIDFNSKLYGVFGQADLQDQFVFWTFLFSALLSFAILIRNGKPVKKQDVINGVLLGIPNQLITYCMVRVVSYLPAYLAFPLASAGVILAVNVINFVVFREKLSPRELKATGLIGLALILLNL